MDTFYRVVHNTCSVVGMNSNLTILSVHVYVYVLNLMFINTRRVHCPNISFNQEMNPIYDRGPDHVSPGKDAQFSMDGYEIDYTCLDFISVIGKFHSESFRLL